MNLGVVDGAGVEVAGIVPLAVEPVLLILTGFPVFHGGHIRLHLEGEDVALSHADFATLAGAYVARLLT